MSPTLLSNSNGFSDIPLNGHEIGPLTKNPQRTQTVPLDRQERQETQESQETDIVEKQNLALNSQDRIVLDHLQHTIVRPLDDLDRVILHATGTHGWTIRGTYSQCIRTQSYPASKHMVHHHISSTKQTVQLLLSSFVTRSTVLRPQDDQSFGYIDTSALLTIGKIGNIGIVGNGHSQKQNLALSSQDRIVLDHLQHTLGRPLDELDRVILHATGTQRLDHTRNIFTMYTNPILPRQQTYGTSPYIIGYTFFATSKRRKDSDTLCRTESLAQIANSQ